jgi:hypothetical protein
MLKTFGMEIGEHTVHDLEKNCFSFVCSSNSSSAMRNTKNHEKVYYEDLDRAMLVWFNQQRTCRMPRSGLICTKQAKFLFEALRLDGNFDASSGWLTRFKQRHGIREMSIQGEKLAGD